jgi:hypothetical protein
MAGRDIEDPAGLPAVNVADDDETQPLNPSTTRMEHKESVYSFMLFVPPLARRRTGHYWTTEVLLAFALLALNVTLQVGLTLIAGKNIVSSAQLFKDTLLSSDSADTPWLKAFELADHHANEITQTVVDSVSSKDAKAAPTCCDGAKCADYGLPCCMRSGARPHTAHEPMRKNLTNADIQKLPGGSNASFLAFGKPAGGSDTAVGTANQKSDADVEDLGTKLPGTHALCQETHGSDGETHLHCTASSFGFINAWSDLDRDGDGMWTLEEARADEANLGCRLGLPVEEVFRSTCRGVQKDNEDTSEHPPFNVHLVPLSVSERRAIPKAYFDWWIGLAVICTAHDVSRCGELVSKGLFDGAIGAGPRFTKGGIQDLDSALDYCQRLLRPGGMCEKTLPGAYMMYRSRVTEKCGAPSYSTGARYDNPFQSRDVMSTIAVKYATVDEYTTASSFQFCFFQSLILFLYFVNLLGELKAIIHLGDFIVSFETDERVPLLTPRMRRILKPWTRTASRHISSLSHSMSMASFGSNPPAPTPGEAEDASDEEEEIGNVDKTGNHVITKISRAHKITVTSMFLVRVFVLVYMFHVGSMFLLTNHKYDDLLLNAVALAFIFELPEFLYAFLVSDEMKSDLEGIHTADYVTALPTRGCTTMLLSKSLWGTVIIPIVVLVVVVFHYEETTMPSLRALQCTCFQIGDDCGVASKFDRMWWNSYWKDIGTMFHETSIFR